MVNWLARLMERERNPINIADVPALWRERVIAKLAEDGYTVGEDGYAVKMEDEEDAGAVDE